MKLFLAYFEVIQGICSSTGLLALNHIFLICLVLTNVLKENLLKQMI